MTGFLQAVAYGLLQGGLLALVAVGFSLVWGVMNVVNLSHGAFVVLGAYVGLPVSYTHLDVYKRQDLGYSFQRRFYELSGRRHAVRLVVQVLNLVEPYARMHAHLSGARPAIDENRRQLVEALSAGDADALVATVVRGIEHTRDLSLIHI